jgi:hypothetical protein
MGYELRRQLREALGPDITGLQRAVALEIADDANERTRRSAAPLEKLALWTGAKDTNVVRNALKRLAASGWELRVPIGKGRDGRVLYAVPGQRMTFIVPHFEGVATATPSGPKGEQGLPHGGAGATPQTPQGVAGAHSEGATATPSSLTPQEEEASTVAPIDLKAFGDFWLTYPKSRNKDATLTAWREALARGADPRQIIAAAQAYAREKQDEDFRYVKYSVNWLRERRYEDDYAPESNSRPALRAVSGGWTAPNRPHPATGASAPTPTTEDYENSRPF